MIATRSRHRISVICCCSIATAFVGLIGAFAHGDLHDRIDQLSAELANNPCDAELLAKRAELHRQHQAWSNALADIRLARDLRNEPADLLIESIILLDSGNNAEAKLLLDQVLKESPANTFALVARARALARQQKPLAAVKDYSAATTLLPKPAPDLFLEQARCFVSAGDRTAAVESLDRAMGRIGRLPSLERYALDLEVELGRFDAALQRLSVLEHGSRSRFDLRLLRGEILLKAGRRDEAREVFASTLGAIQSQPERMNARIREIRSSVQTYLQDF